MKEQTLFQNTDGAAEWPVRQVRERNSFFSVFGMDDSPVAIVNSCMKPDVLIFRFGIENNISGT